MCIWMSSIAVLRLLWRCCSRETNKSPNKWRRNVYWPLNHPDTPTLTIAHDLTSHGPCGPAATQFV